MTPSRSSCTSIERLRLHLLVDGEGPEKVPGFADTDRIVPHRTDEADSASAQNVDIRTRPDRTNAKAQA